MAKIFILVVHTKLTFNLVYNGLKGAFYALTLLYRYKQGYKTIVVLDL